MTAKVSVFRTTRSLSWLGRWSVWCPHCLERSYWRSWLGAMDVASDHAGHAPRRR